MSGKTNKMKKTQRKDALRNIKKRLVSYLSVSLVIMLGLGGLFITRYMGAGINAESARYYNDHNFKNFELISSLGIADADVEQIRNMEGVIDAEGVIRASASVSKDELTCNVDLISMTERVSVPEVVEGRAPSAKNECMIGEDLAEVKGLKVGDVVNIAMDGSAQKSESDDGDAGEESEKEEVLLESEFTITGLMKHPDYFRRKSTDNVVLPWEAFNRDYLGEFQYSHVFVKTEDGGTEDIFSGKYFQRNADTKHALEELSKVLEQDSLSKARASLNDHLDKEWQKALEELENGQNEIDENETKLNTELADARKELEDAQKELDSKVADARKKIKDGEKKIRNAEKKIKNGEKELKDYREKLREADEKLPAAKKYVEEMRAEYQGELEESLRALMMAQKLLDALKGLDPDSQEFRDAVKNLADFVLDNQDTIRKFHDFFSKDEVLEIAEKLKDLTGIDATGTIAAIKAFDVERLIYVAAGASGFDGDINAFIEDTQQWIDSIKDSLNKLDEYESYIKEYEAKRSDLYEQLEQKEKELAAAKKELAAAKKKLAASKKQLAAEKSKYQAQITDGWNLYFSKKEEFESKLDDAKALLTENREEAEAKFAELKAEVDELECKWLVLDRRANAGYVDIKSNIGAIKSSSIIFGALFLLISAIVCFSTLSIIIEEQKKMVGTVKAFGFHKGEVLGKYLVFGVSASVIGCIAGILLALGLSGAVLKAYYNTGMYPFNPPKSVVTPGITALACALMIAVCTLATVIACSDILKSPASILMKGGKAKKNTAKKARKTKESSIKRGSLYSRLIIRNMLDDKVRVIISILIIAFSTLMVGTGISMKLAFDGMSEKQVSDIYKYDVRVDLGDEIDEEDREDIERIMTDNGADYTLASYTSHVLRIDDRLDAVNVLAGDPELTDFFTVEDFKRGGTIELPEDGVLVQKKMKESYGMGEGRTVTIFSDELDECSADVKGVFQNYVGRLIITSPDGYKKVFGTRPPANCYYVKLGGTGLEKFKSDILAAKDDVSFEVASEFAKKFKSASMLYNLIVIITTGIAILMSFMILSNLANIFLNRKKTELTVMRINGFSIKQTKGYLIKETVITTAAGVLLGILAGAVGTPIIIRAVEQPDLQFVRTFHAGAWAIASALEIIFALVIYGAVFRKVKDLNFRDVQ